MSAKGIIGSIYFSPDRDKENRPISKYEGIIKALIIRRDDGSEFTVESDETLPYSKIPLDKEELSSIPVGTLVCSLDGIREYTVLKVFPVYGDLWVRDNETSKVTVKKYTDLRRAS